MANRRDIAGLLTGIPSGGIDPRVGMTGRQMLTQSALEGQRRMTSGLRGMFNMGATPQQQIQQKLGEAIQGFDTKTIDEQKKLVTALQISGQTGLAAQLASRLKDNISKQEEKKSLELNKDIVSQMYPKSEWAQKLAARGVPLETIQKLASDTTEDREDLVEYVSETYGEEESKRLKPLILNGSVQATDISSMIQKDNPANKTPKNMEYIVDGEKVVSAVLFDTQGNTFDMQNNPIELPSDAKIHVTGRTPSDVAYEAGGGKEAPVIRLSDEDAKTILEDINESENLLNKLSEISDQELQNTLTLGGSLKGKTGDILSYLGVGESITLPIVGKVDLGSFGEKAQELQDFGADNSLTIQLLEEYFLKRKHDVTGAQAALREIEQLREAILNRKTTPNRARAQINRIIQREITKVTTNRDSLEKGYYTSLDSYFKGTSNYEDVRIEDNRGEDDNSGSSNEDIINRFLK